MFRGPTKYSEYLQDVPKSIDYILKRVNAVTVSDLQAVTNAGATTTLPITTGGITTDYVQLKTAATPTLAVGMTRWNASLGVPETRLGGGNVTGQQFLENFVVAINKTGATLNESEFRVVRIRSVAEGGAQGQRLAVVLAQADSDANSATTIGIVTETVLNNQQGLFTTNGDVNDIDTTGAMSWGGLETWVDGDILYLSPDHAGYLTKVKPIAPQHMIVVGWVVYAHAVHGKIFVKVDNGYELDELHNVRITSVANNDLLQYDSALAVWKNVASSVAVPTPTLAQVTTAGNTTTNGIVIGSSTAITASPYTLQVVGGSGGSAIFSNAAKTQGLNINLTTAGETRIYGDYFGAGVDQKLILGTFANRATQLVLHTSGNVGIGTTTDAGYKLDVNGTIRSTSSIWTDFLSPIGSTMYIYSIGLSGGAYNRLNVYYNSVNGFVMQSDGGGGGSRSMSVFGGGPGGVLNLGTNGATRWTLLSSYDASGPGHFIPNGTNTYDIGNSSNTVRNLYSNRAIFSGSVTASAALANAVSVANTLVAAANNDVLVGLDINPTFTNGAFTGVTNWGIRSAADFAFTARNSTITVLSPAASSNGNSLTIKAGNATTSGTGGNLLLLSGSGVGGPGSGQVIIGNDTSTYNNVVLRGYTYVQSTGPNQGTAFAVLAGGQTALSIYWDNLTPFMQYGLVTSRQSRFVNSSSYSFDNNLIIGATTNAGYKLDVNGTARIQGVITGSVGSGAITLGAAAANQSAISINGYFTGNGAIITSNANGRSFNSIIGAQNSGIISSYNGNAQGQTVANHYFLATGNINLTDGAIDLNAFAFTPTIVSETGATIKAFSSTLSAASNHYNLYLSGTAQNYLAGNVGIGTTSPQGATHIAVASGTPALVLSDVGSPNTIPTLQFRRGPLSAFSLQVDFPSNIKARFQIGDAVTGYEFTGGNLGLTGGRSIEFAGITGQTATAIVGSVHTDNNNGQLLFSTRGSGVTAERMRISSSGNVGIGTDQPVGQLNVFGGTGNNPAILTLQSQSGGGGNTGIYFRPYQNVTFANTAPAQATILAVDASYSAHITFSTKIPGAGTNSLVERMRLTSTGSLMIGSTTDTGEALQVTGSIKSTALSTDGPVVSSGGVLNSVNGYTGMVTIQQPAPMPPITFDIQNGIIVNVM
jgi:hypothetical protein